jgi:hypothetical protein
MSYFDMSEAYTSVEEQVTYGLEKIDPSRTITLSLRDFIYLHNTLDELVRFFHQPMHYETLEDVSQYLGNRDTGAFHLLSDLLYKKFNFRDILPPDIVGMVEDGEFENPNPPYYYKPKR